MHVTFVHSHYENLGIEHVSAVLKEAGHKTDLVYEPALFHNFFLNKKALFNIFNFRSYIIDEVAKRKPDIISFSVISDNYNWALETAKEIRKRCDVIIVFGGIHITSVPEYVLKDGIADYIVIGEGEYAFLDLVNSLENGRDTTEILNIGSCINGKIKINGVRAPIENLDVLPYPDKDLFYNECRQMVVGSYMIMGMRGCNNKCSYCWNSTIHNLYGGKRYFRRRSPENVVGELEIAKHKYKSKKVTFYDEIITADKPWFRKFAKLYKEKVNLPYFCCIYPADLDEELIELLVDSNCSVVNMGLQTADADTRKKVLHRSRGANGNVEDAFALLRKTKIFVYANVMLGLPGEDENDVLRTLDFCIENPTDMAAIYWLRYYPGTDMIKIAHDKGNLSKEDVERINESKEYAPYAIGGSTYDKDLSKLGNCILLSSLLPKKAIKFVVRKKMYKYFPSNNLLFPMIVIACFIQKVFNGKKATFHYLNVYDYSVYYLFYMRKKLKYWLFRKRDKEDRPVNRVQLLEVERV